MASDNPPGSGACHEDADWADRAHVLMANANQAAELQKQDGDPEVTCPCGATGPLRSGYRCFYCGVVFCPDCAEGHFEDGGGDD